MQNLEKSVLKISRKELQKLKSKGYEVSVAYAQRVTFYPIDQNGDEVALEIDEDEKGFDATEIGECFNKFQNGEYIYGNSDDPYIELNSGKKAYFDVDEVYEKEIYTAYGEKYKN